MYKKHFLEGIQDLVFSDRYALKDPNKQFGIGDKVVVLISSIGPWEQRGVGFVEDIPNDYELDIRLVETDEVVTRPKSNVDLVLEDSPSLMWDRMTRWLVEKTEKTTLSSEDNVLSDKKDIKNEFRWALEDFRFSPGGRINAYLGSEELANLTSMPNDFDGLDLTAYNCYVLPLKPNAHYGITNRGINQIQDTITKGLANGATYVYDKVMNTISNTAQPSLYGSDSRNAIMDTAKNMCEIMARGGGCGINISALRPSNTFVQGVNGHSSGSVSWGSLYSTLTGLISQGGSRRGALMLLLDVSHPDIVEFIFSKVRPSETKEIQSKWQTKFPKANFVAHEIDNANISVAISDDFMKAVKNDENWDLIFPDYEEVGPDIYNTKWDGNIRTWKAQNLPVKVYDTVRARDLWNCLMESAWRSAEPGVVFLERYNKMSNSWYTSEIICTNPCGEQGLPAWGVCNLGHINLSRFTKGKIGEAEICWDELRRAIRAGVRFLDDVIDYTQYYFHENWKRQKGERRVGLGTLGLGELLIRCGKKYGPDSKEFIDELYRFIAVEAYMTSIDLAEEKGACPAFDYDNFAKSGFMQNLLPHLPPVYHSKLRTTGIRNLCLLTQAPTGSTGTMIGTSTGIEPYYAWAYYRSGRLGTRLVKERIVNEYLAENPLARPDTDIGPDEISEHLPSYFVCAKDLDPEGHVVVQATIQKWVDASISKTANCPADFSIEDTGRLYELAYELGCKGVTIYRDGSRDTQVLNDVADTTQTTDSETQATFDEAEEARVLISKLRQELPRVITRPDVLDAKTEKIETPHCGKLYVTVGFTDEDGVIETMISGGEGETEISALCDFAGRLISTARKYNVPLSEIIKQANKVPGGKPFFYKADSDEKGRLLKNIPSAVGFVLTRYIKKPGRLPLLQGSDDQQNVSIPSYEKCSKCGGHLIVEDGCETCRDCGFSRCS